jgi:hypothetical protein
LAAEDLRPESPVVVVRRAAGVTKRMRIKGKYAISGILLLVGLLLWFARGSSNSKQAAQPLIDALERYRELSGSYPRVLDSLVREKLLRSIPRPAAIPPLYLPCHFQYWVDPDLDYYCLGYGEQELLATQGYDISYVSFRGEWDDSPGVPMCDLFGLPLDRAGDLFRKSRSSKDLRRFIEIAAHKYNKDPWPLFWEDVIQAVGNMSPLRMDGRNGFWVEAREEEAAAFGFIVDPKSNAFRNKHEVILIIEREGQGTQVRWHEIFRASRNASVEKQVPRSSER